MLRVRDIMTTDVTTVSPQTTIREAMELFAREHVSGAPVVSGNTVLGVVSGSDLLSFAATVSAVPALAESSEWEDEDVRAPELDAENGEALDFFSEMWDDAGTELNTRFASVEGPEWNVLEEHDVGEVMTHGVLWSVPPTADARWAADLMREHGIHRVLVLDGDTLVGIVTSMDITRAVAEGRFTKRAYVFNRYES